MAGTRSVHLRLTETTLRDLRWIGKQRGGLDRTNTIRVLVAEAKARHLEELQREKDHELHSE